MSAEILKLSLKSRLEIPVNSPYDLTPHLVATTILSCALVCFFGTTTLQVIICGGLYVAQFFRWFYFRKKTENMFVYLALEAQQMMPHLKSDEILVGVLQFWKENNGPALEIKSLPH